MKINHLRQFSRFLLTTLSLFVLSACGSSNNNSPSEKALLKIPDSIQKLTLPAGALRAWITVDAQPRAEITLDRLAGTGSVTINGLSFDIHTILIEYEYSDTNGTILVASYSTSVDTTSGSASINIAENLYTTSFDDDEDGVTNAKELEAGTNPFGQPNFPVSCFPLKSTTFIGNVLLSFDGDLLFTDGSDNIQRVDHLDCSLTSLSTISGESLVSLVENKLRNRIYAAGTTGIIYEIDPDTGDFTRLYNSALFPTGMAIAPSGYGQFAGQLIIGAIDSANGSGQILAIDQSVSNPAPVIIAQFSGAAGTVVVGASVVFGDDDTLYAAIASFDTNTATSSGIIYTVDSGGISTPFVSAGLTQPASLAIDNAGSRLLIADGGSGDIFAASIPQGDLTSTGSFNFDTAGLPGIVYDNRISLMIITASLQIEVRVVNSFNTSCLPLTVPGTQSGAASYTGYGRNGDLLFTSASTDSLSVLSRKGCLISTLANNVSSGNQLLGVTYDQDRDVIYTASTDSNVYSVDPQTGTSTLLISLISEANGLVIAPPGYGVYGGQLIAALANGDVVVIDQTQSPAVQRTITSTGGQLADLVFGSDGTLYIADYLNDSIITLESDGTSNLFVTNGLGGPDGLVFDNIGSRLIVASSDNDVLWQVSIPAGLVSGIGASAEFDNGFFPSGLFFDQRNTLLMGLGENSQTITPITL